MAGMSNWTQGNIAELVARALHIALIEPREYCEYCMVVPVAYGEKYCMGCANNIADDLAAQYTEQGQVEKGLY